MNLNPLFTKQKQLDDRINKEKGLQGQDLLDKKILALQVELGELANEWRGFKFWSEDQEPRNKDVKCHACNGKGFYDFVNSYTNEHFTEECGYCDGTGFQEKNPLLEEYVDNFHFILSIGNVLDATYEIISIKDYEKWNTTQLFNAMFYQLAMFENDIHNNALRKNQLIGYELVFNVFLSIGKRLGFTWEQIEQAYYKKNEINHARQQNGY